MITIFFDKDLADYIKSNLFRREEDKLLDKLNGRSCGVFKSRSNIINTYVKPFNEFSDTVFSYSVEGTSEQKYIEILKLVLRYKMKDNLMILLIENYIYLLLII